MTEQERLACSEALESAVCAWQGIASDSHDLLERIRQAVDVDAAALVLGDELGQALSRALIGRIWAEEVMFHQFRDAILGEIGGIIARQIQPRPPARHTYKHAPGVGRRGGGNA